MYRIDGRDVLLDWLAGESDPQRRLGMLEWMAELAAEPLKAAHRVPSIRAPVYIAVVPLQPPVLVTFLHAFQFHTVKLLAIRPAP